MSKAAGPAGKSKMKVVFFGTTTLLFDDGKDQILFDAHLTRPSLRKYLFGRVSTDKNTVDGELKLHHVDRLRGIFVSHSHHDHVMDAPYIARRTGAAVYGSSSTLNVARGGDVPEERMKQFQADETYEIGDFRIKVIPSLHSKATVFNNDLGRTIDMPLRQPARLRDYKEGGSFDFYMEHGDRRIMIRPSFNYIEGQMDGYQADVLFQGVARMQQADAGMLEAFYRETIDKLRPGLVVPIHWDNFFSPLTKPVKGMPRPAGKTEVEFFKLAQYCKARDIDLLVQIPGTGIEI